MADNVILYRTRDEILADMVASLLARIPDAYQGDEGALSIILRVVAGADESVFHSIQLLYDDMFVETASESALMRRGDERGVERHQGVVATGELTFIGAGGTEIPSETTEVAYDAGTGEDPLYFVATETGTIPNPGAATKPVVADGGAGSLPAGTYEYGVTFTTAEGETDLGDISDPIVLAAAHSIDLTGIATGGPGTVGRKIYRAVDGGDFLLAATIADNVTVAATDDNDTPAGLPPEVSTAERITLAAAAEEPGQQYNILTGSINTLTSVPDGVTDVINAAPFTNGTDPEEVEDYRGRLQEAIRNPSTGSPGDLKTWAEEIDGVESATVFENDNLGTPTPGHSTIRISGVNGSTPSADLIANVLTTVQARDIANITLHVAGFVETPTDVSVTITPQSGYVVADVEDTVVGAITNYINSLEVGETLKVAGIYSAVFGLPGVADVVVDSPATNQATGATSKRTVGTIGVS